MGKYEDLEKLKNLKESGVITEIEYEVEKSKLLNDTYTDKKETNGLDIASLILGILAICLCWASFLSVIVTIVALIVSLVARSRNKNGLNTAGLVLSVLVIIGYVLLVVFAFFSFYSNISLTPVA